MKRKLSLILAIALCFSSFVAVFAAENENTEETAEEVVQAAEKNWDDLNLAMKSAFELGIIERDYSGKLNLSETVSRADFVQMVYGMVNYQSNAAPEPVTKQYYIDVGLYHYASNEIGRLTEAGIVTGYTDGYFRPEQPITVEEATIVLMNLAGYKKFVEYSDSTAFSMARNKDLFKKLSVMPSDALTRENAAGILGNILMLKTVVDNGRTVSASGDIVLDKYLELDYQDGVITAAGGVSLYGEDVSERTLVINGNKYYCNEDVDYKDYVGYNARVFVDRDDTVIAVIPDRNKILTMNSKDIMRFENNAYTYEVNGRKKTIKVNPEKDILLNGLYTSDISQMVPACGKVTLIDNDNDGTYDIVKIDSFYTYVVDSVIANEKIIVMKNTDQNGKQIVYDFNDWHNYEIIDPDGYTTEFYDIKQDTVVSIAPSGSDKVTIYLSKKTVDANISETHFDENTVIADDTEYYVIDEPYMGLWDGQPGVVMTLLLDKFGNVAGFTGIKSGDWKYGFIIKCFVDDESDAILVKMLDQDGEIKNVSCEEKVTIDSTTYKDSYLAMEEINNCYDNFEQNKPGENPTTDNDEKKFERVSTRLMRYYLSSSGKIKKIDTPVFKSAYDAKGNKSDISDCLQITAKGRLHYSNTFSYMLRVPYADNSEVSGEIMTGSAPIIFAVPMNKEDLNDKTEMGVYKSLSQVCVNDVNYGASGYTVNDGSITSDVVVVTKLKGASSSELDVGIFDKVTIGLNSDNEQTYYVHGIFDNAQTQFELSEKNTFKIDTLKKGDVILYSKINGNIKVEYLGFRASTGTGILADNAKYITRSGEGHYFAKGRVILARVQRMEGNTAIITYDNSTYPNEFMPNIAKGFMCNPDMGKDAFTQIDPNAIKTTEIYGDNADYLIINQRDGYIYDQYIIRK